MTQNANEDTIADGTLILTKIGAVQRRRFNEGGENGIDGRERYTIYDHYTPRSKEGGENGVDGRERYTIIIG